MRFIRMSLPPGLVVSEISVSSVKRIAQERLLTYRGPGKSIRDNFV